MPVLYTEFIINLCPQGSRRRGKKKSLVAA